MHKSRGKSQVFPVLVCTEAPVRFRCYLKKNGQENNFLRSPKTYTGLQQKSLRTWNSLLWTLPLGPYFTTCTSDTKYRPHVFRIDILRSNKLRLNRYFTTQRAWSESVFYHETSSTTFYPFLWKGVFGVYHALRVPVTLTSLSVTTSVGRRSSHIHVVK